MKILQGNFRAK